MALCSSTVAAAKDYVQPVQVGQETVRWNQGEWLLDQQRATGGVQLRHVGWDHGYMAFEVVMLNATSAPINFDISSIRAEGPAGVIPLVSAQEMVTKAKNRAKTAMFLTALAGGLAAASAANDRNHYRATTFTPHGTYTTFVDAPNPNAGANAALISAGTAGSIVLMQKRLDETRAQLKNDAVQLTTVDPGQTYGGLIYLERFPKKAPTAVKLFVKIGDEEYPFAIRFANKNDPAPAFRAIAVQSEAPVAAPATIAPAGAPAPTPSAPAAVTPVTG